MYFSRYLNLIIPIDEKAKNRMKIHHIKQEIIDSHAHYQMGPKTEVIHGLDHNEDVIYIHNKSHKDDVIEYNPAELSLEESDAESGMIFIVIQIYSRVSLPRSWQRLDRQRQSNSYLRVKELREEPLLHCYS